MIENITISRDNFKILSELTKTEILVLSQLFNYVSTEGSYKDVIILNSSIRKAIVDSIDIKQSSFNNLLNSLGKKNILERLDTNMYKISKDIFKF